MQNGNKQKTRTGKAKTNKVREKETLHDIVK